MHRIEMYMDKSGELVIDLYYEFNDLQPIRRFKGQACYELISIICSQPIKRMQQKNNKETIVLTYDEYIVNINEYEKVLGLKKITPIKSSINQYCKSQKSSEKGKKVTRKNKYIGQKIIASALVLATLGSVAFFFSKKGSDKESVLDSTSITYLKDDLGDINPTEDILISEDEDFVSKPSSVPEDMLLDAEEDNCINVSISYEDRSETDKAKRTEAWYGETIRKYAEKYGLDPRIVIAIATQERGIHSEEMDLGGATGLMQIQNDIWRNQELTAYNYETESYETIVVNEDRLSDVYYNIRVGCMVFQNCMDYMDNNVFAAIQCYNMGNGNMRKILKAYSKDTGKSIQEILSDISDCGWLKYRDIIKVGDQEYLENVLSWIGSKFNIENLNLNGTIVSLDISNESQTKKCIN